MERTYLINYGVITAESEAVSLECTSQNLRVLVVFNRMNDRPQPPESGPPAPILQLRFSSSRGARQTATEENDDEDEQLCSALDKITIELEIGKYL